MTQNKSHPPRTTSHSPVFEPNIIVFACNWCSYAGADLAGVSRLQYPPNVKINRIMCTGRISSSIILNAFQLGADGVLICGCHIGDCHYLSGNKKAAKVVETTFALVNALGIGEERLRLEWISAAEGPKFAATMTEFTQQIRKQGPNPLNKLEKVASKEEIDLKEILKKAKTYHCYSCTQCTGGCPISRTRTIYNPRKQMRRLLYGMEDKVLNDLELWSCLTCGVCNSRCPHEVDLVEFIKNTRAKAKSKDICGVNAHDGLFQKITQIQIQTDVLNRGNWLTKDLKTSKKGEYLYFVGCLPYYQTIFSENGSNLISIAQNTIKILNKMGIEPIVLDNEKCCGHDMLYSGDKEGFNKLAKYNLNLIKKSKAKKVIFSCPECNLAFNKDYQENFGNLGFEAIHITQLLNDKLPNGTIKLKEIKAQFPKFP